MVEIGGDLMTAGLNPQHEPWHIGVERPDAGQTDVQAVVTLSDMGMATSGDYRNYFEQDGRRYSHILDPMTGRPVTHQTASVTVLAGDAMTADAWATALLALGQDRGLPLARQLDMAVMFISRDNQAGDVAFSIATTPRFDTHLPQRSLK